MFDKKVNEKIIFKKGLVHMIYILFDMIIYLNDRNLNKES